jgi:hypothetical protein
MLSHFQAQNVHFRVEGEWWKNYGFGDYASWVVVVGI